MAVIAALLDSQAAMASLRRATPRLIASVRGCRTVAAFHRVLETELVDAAVLGVRAAQAVDLGAVRARFPIVPLVVFGAVRSDQGTLLHELQQRGVRALVVEGVDDPVVGEVVTRVGVLARRRTELADLSRSLRLTEPLQRRTLDRLLARIGAPPPTANLARDLGVSREHLSRQFAAGGAPNLKRVIDLLQVLAARDLIANPGYSLTRVASALGFASESHLRVAVRRVARMSLKDFRKASAAEVQRRFAHGATRSRQ